MHNGILLPACKGSIYHPLLGATAFGVHAGRAAALRDLKPPYDRFGS
jgi:hypothetical protein